MHRKGQCMFWDGLTCRQSTPGKELRQQHLAKTGNRIEMRGQIPGREAQKQNQKKGGGGGGGELVIWLFSFWALPVY